MCGVCIQLLLLYIESCGRKSSKIAKRTFIFFPAVTPTAVSKAADADASATATATNMVVDQCVGRRKLKKKKSAHYPYPGT